MLKRKFVNGESIRATLNQIPYMSYLIKDEDEFVDTVYSDLTEYKTRDENPSSSGKQYSKQTQISKKKTGIHIQKYS